MVKQGGVVLPMWTDVWLDISMVDNFLDSSLFLFGGSWWEVANGFSKIMILVSESIRK
jgi:hypothetical protein